MGVYACSDIHGNLAIAQQVVDIANDGNTIYFLGDACDRGEYGWEIIKMFLRTENIVYLMGNHEDMLIKAMRSYFYRPEDDSYEFSHAFEVWSWNGNDATFNSILDDDFEKASMYFSQLHTLKMFADYTNSEGNKIYMCHSGWEYFLRDEYHDLKYNEKIIWDRNHYFEPHWLGYDNEYMIHGHTPIPYLDEEINPSRESEITPGAYQYCEGHKIDIDMLTIVTHQACLFNLDTFENILLEGEK